jgi:hypothetical protein
MSLLDDSIASFEKSLNEDAMTVTWSDIKRKGRPAEVAIRNVYRGYVLNGNFFYLSGDEVKSCSVGAPAIAKNLKFTDRQPALAEEADSLPLLGKAGSAMKKIFTRHIAIKAAVMLYNKLSQELASNPASHSKDPAVIAADVYDVDVRDVMRHINKLNESVGTQAFSIASKLVSIDIIDKVLDVQSTASSIVATVVDTSGNQYIIDIKPVTPGNGSFYSSKPQ